MIAIETMLKSCPHIIIAGNVKIIPPAIDSPTAATEATKLASNIESFLNTAFNIPVPNIEAGIAAAIVNPVFNPKYTFDAANITANKIPNPIETAVVSDIAVSIDTKGLN